MDCAGEGTSQSDLIKTDEYWPELERFINLRDFNRLVIPDSNQMKHNQLKHSLNSENIEYHNKLYNQHIY